MIGQKNFEVRRMPLSKPIYPKQRTAIVLGVIFCVLALIFFIAKIVSFGIVCAGTALILVPYIIKFALKNAMQRSKCPYCKREILMLRKEVSFNCPLCGMPIEKSEYEIVNAKPLGKYGSSEQAEQTEQRSLENYNKRIIEMIVNDFAKIGWNKWDADVHEKNGQLKRLERATVYGSGMRLLQYNSLRGIAKIKGDSGSIYLTSGERCSCPDYRERLLPCKHMYKLCVLLTDNEAQPGLDTSSKGSYAHDNVFGGLVFTIIGRNQTPVKEFIVEHSGRFGNSNINKSSAVVLASDTMTGTRADAIAKDVEILTFEQLQNLFDIFEDDKNINIKESML